MKRSARTSLTILVVLLDEIILAAIILFVLWRLGIHLPLWVVIALVVALGVIKVRGELWKAYSTDASISADEAVIVVELEGLKLLVRRKDVEIIPGTGRTNRGGSA